LRDVVDLHLHNSWEWANKEGRRLLVRTMIQEAGCDVGTKSIVWVKIKPDYEILFRLMDGLDPGDEWRYWIREHGTEGDIGDIQEGLGQIYTGVKISLPVPHNGLTKAEEYVQSGYAL
jgi:hypothetical protein